MNFEEKMQVYFHIPDTYPVYFIEHVFMFQKLNTHR